MTAVAIYITVSAAFALGYVVSALVAGGHAESMKAEWFEQGRQSGFLDGLDKGKSPRRPVAMEWAEARVPAEKESN